MGSVAKANKSGPSIRVGNPEGGGGPTGAGILGDHQRLGDGDSFSVHDAQGEGVGGAGLIFLHHRLPESMQAKAAAGEGGRRPAGEEGVAGEGGHPAKGALVEDGESGDSLAELRRKISHMSIDAYLI